MAYPHVSKTIAELAEPWFLDQPRGKTYGAILQSKFDAADNRAAIESALTLGGYLLHIESQKHKRRAVRAVMLANFLMKGFPVQQHAQLRERSESFSLEELKAEFVFLFPALLDNGNRSSWHPAFFTDPANLVALHRQDDWRERSVPRYRFIVHTVREPLSRVSLFHDPVTELANCDALSMSLIGNEHPYTHSMQGFIFRVPMNNILVTSSRDMAFPNYQPSVHRLGAQGQAALADEIIRIAAEQGGLRTPSDVIHGSAAHHYNEIVVCGRPNVKLPHGTTELLTLLGVFVCTTMAGALHVRGDLGQRFLELASQSAFNNNVPLVYLPKDF
ncbi:hypothetical protein [Ideonella sp. A 288]|uniref:hypothetical protein n=1 Tax=Ideonella sp. A 288 TaxID=1962181 RepID=UPI001184739D|nr:hypothetical protein [Ideonella sp. A 288]